VAERRIQLNSPMHFEVQKMAKTLEILITTVAKAVEDGEIEEQFEYRSGTYKKLLDWEHFDRLLGELKLICRIAIVLFTNFVELNRNTGFYLKKLEVNDHEHLLLCYSNEIIKTPSCFERIQKNFLMNSFFEKFDGTEAEDLNLITDKVVEGRELSLDDFYERLRKSHENDDLETGLPIDVQHSSLRPILRPYQKKGIKWMLKRELHEDHLPSFYVKIRSKFNSSQIFFYNTYTQAILSDCPESQILPKGGLLTGNLLNLLLISQ
jgi:SNF2 family DNA or RNA helicase